MAGGVAFGVAGDVAVGVAFGVAGGVAFGVAGGVAFGVAFAVAFVVTVLRLENWLFGLMLNWRYLRNGSFLIPRNTFIPLPYLNSRLKNWLLQDWENGVHNVNQLLAYTMQFIPVIQAVNKALKKKPSEEIILSVSQLANNPFDWQLIKYISDLRQPSIKKPHRAAAAGFWYLHEKQLTKATEAFKVVRSLLYGEEMYILALTLAEFNNTQELNSIANLKLPTFPTSGLLRPVTWQILDRFVKVI